MTQTRNAPFLSHTVAGRLGALGQAPANTGHGCGLGIDGLPQGLDRLPLGTPVALAWQEGTADAQWVQALLRDLLQDGPLMVLAENTPSTWLQQPDLAQAFAQGRLQLCRMAEPLPATHHPQDMPPVFSALPRAGLGDTHALLVLNAPLLQWAPSLPRLRQWGQELDRWCSTRTRPVVFAFQHGNQALQALSPLHQLAGVFAHVAVLGSEAGHPMLLVERWNGYAGQRFEAGWGLTTDGQRLAYDGRQRSGPQQRLLETPGPYRIIATQAVLAGQRGVPAEWQVLAQLEEVRDASRDAIGATVLLDGGATPQFEALLDLVYALRTQHGPSLKIVVRETQDKLRANLEQALLCLGANAVIYREVGFARMLRQIEALSDSRFTRTIPPDLAQARCGFMPDVLRGYLKPDTFCDTVQAMLERTREMGLPHSFLRLAMQPQVAHVDAIQACLALRDGDVLTADHDALYVFMFACAETDIDPALARLFAIPPGKLFAAQTLYTSSTDMRTALRAVREAAHQGAPDYSAFRRAPSVTSTPRPAPAAAPAHAHLQEQQTQPIAETVPTPLVRPHPLARRTLAPTEGNLDVD